MQNLRMLIPAAWWAMAAVSADACANYTGGALKLEIEACERIEAHQPGANDDLKECFSAQSYIAGVMAVQGENSLKALVLIDFATHSPNLGKKDSSTQRALDKQEIETASYFAPLIRVPDDVTLAQAMAIVQKYLLANPEKWNKNAAILIEEALAAAYPKQAK